jgi:hypothetical protein
MKLFVCMFAIGLLVLVVPGCGGNAPRAAKTPAPAKSEQLAGMHDAPVPDEGELGEVAAVVAHKGAAKGGGEAGQKQDDGAQHPVQPIPRKIIYTAEVKLVVDDLPRAEEQLRHLIKQSGGFVAQSELSGSAGSRRSGHWRLRVPVDGFDAFMAEIVKLGFPEVNKTDSQDVTDQYYDLEARIKNRKSEEESLRKLLEETHGKMEDILAVRRELNQVRGDIDQKEGQLRRLANLSSLTTVNVTLREEKDYVPPQSPTFGSNLADTFAGSLEALQKLGRGVVLGIVALVPWLPVLLLVVTPAWLLVRRRRGLLSQQVAGSVPPPAAAPPVA